MRTADDLCKFNPVVCERILDAIRSGATQGLAAEYAGIGRKALGNWLKWGEDAPEDDPLHVFYVAFHRARGEQAVLTLEKIRAIGDQVQSWQAHAWWLEHTMPREYGKGIFGGDPSEVPEIRHVIEIVREEPPALEAEAEALTRDLQRGPTWDRIEGPHGPALDPAADS